jgi:hypothetical protein
MPPSRSRNGLPFASGLTLSATRINPASPAKRMPEAGIAAAPE